MTGTRTTLIRQTLVPVSVFATVVLLGIAGFVYLADVGVVEATFWLIDPTSIELHFSEHSGPETATKAYSVLVFASLVVSGIWIGESVLSVAFGGQITKELRNMKVSNEIEETQDHVVVCGYGMFGRTVAEKMQEREVEVVIVESESSEYERALDDGFPAVKGDARRDETLSEAGVQRARSVVAAVDDSNVNIQTAIIVSQLAPNARTVVRVGDKMYESLARRAGADEVVIPEVMSGESITDSI